jgi:hypothetical protein
MLIKITLIVLFLVFLNFLLLKFSCNKTPKQTKTRKTTVVSKPEITIEQEPQRLAPTGS